MPDEQETKCILAAILVLRNPREDAVQSDTNEKQLSGSKRSLPPLPIALPDAIIRHGILSYRPFRSFRVVLIRGEDTNGISRTSSCAKLEYALTFRSNRGPLRFLITELPYRPVSVEKEAEPYRKADGVVVSCYMSRFFEFCDRYGYDYAAASILEDVAARRSEPPIAPEENPKPPEFCRSIVLCGNNVDVTHVDARLSSIVFRESIAKETISSATASIDTPRHPFSSLARSLINDNGLEFLNVVDDDNDHGPSEEALDRRCVKRARDNSLDHNNSFEIPPEKYTKGNHDDDPRNWNWLRARVRAS